MGFWKRHWSTGFVENCANRQYFSGNANIFKEFFMWNFHHGLCSYDISIRSIYILDKCDIKIRVKIHIYQNTKFSRFRQKRKTTISHSIYYIIFNFFPPIWRLNQQFPGLMYNPTELNHQNRLFHLQLSSNSGSIEARTNPHPVQNCLLY